MVSNAIWAVKIDGKNIFLKKIHTFQILGFALCGAFLSEVGRGGGFALRTLAGVGGFASRSCKKTA